MSRSTRRVVVIGAGIGGLTTAAVLAREGMDVTVLEAQVYPGGCAATFYHQGYRFDAGATLAGGFYPGGPMDLVALATGVKDWRAHIAQPAMMVHLPENRDITLWSDDRRWSERQRLFGEQGIEFWQWQEQTADAMWNLALRLPPWPAQSYREFTDLIQITISWLKHLPKNIFSSQLFADAIRPVAAHLKHTPNILRLFIDSQLLISAQATSDRVNALYGASALDLSRRGVVHLEGGMGRIAQSLVGVIQQHGGRVFFREEANRIVYKNGLLNAVETNRGHIFPAEIVIANLPPANIVRLLGEHAPARIKKASTTPQDGWGAFIMYVGVDNSVIPAEFPLHHQVISSETLAEGNSIFVSINPAWDHERAPAGHRAVTISTHTNLAPWWHIYKQDKAYYEFKKNAYAEKVMHNVEVAIPGFRQAARLILPGTPVTFQRFTRRIEGWVGGYPQTHLLRTLNPNLGSNLWMVGDSIFPGQSTAATALGGLRVARQILSQLNYQYYQSNPRITFAHDEEFP